VQSTSLCRAMQGLPAQCSGLAVHFWEWLCTTRGQMAGLYVVNLYADSSDAIVNHASCWH
jgi:hypothetical protein